jgi:hypothetical protein
MNEEMIVLLRDLAAQLGTTTEYLWAALLRQAPIYAATEIIFAVLVAVGGAVAYRFTRKSLVTREVAKKYSYSESTEWVSRMEEEPWRQPVMMWGWLLVLVGTIGILFNLSNTLAALFNPEYWALRQVMKLLS